MNVWLVHPGELLPCDGNVRLYRYGILAEMLVEQGHSVTRWAPTFVHATKKLRAEQDQTITVSDRYRIQLLHAGEYRRHFGLKRYLFHKTLARKFKAKIHNESKPDIIVSGMPTPELCYEATQYGRRHQIPVVLDVRDLWPDAFLDHFPKSARGIMRLAFTPMIAQNRRAFRDARGVVGISPGFLDWGLRYARRPAAEADGVFYMGLRRTEHFGKDMQEAVRKWEERGVRGGTQFRCCFFALIGALYDLELLVHAARKLLQSNDHEAQFVICGDGPSLERLRSLAADLPNVILPGWVSPAEVEALLQMSDAAVIPYRSGMQTALPNKAVSYFSAGLPVISTNKGELASLIEEKQCGRLYSPGNVDEFLKTFDELRKNPLSRERLGRNGKVFFDEELEAEKVYGRMIQYLEGLCRSSKMPTVALRTAA